MLDGTPREIFSQVETLRALGLDVPAPTAALWELREAGLPVSLDALDAEACAQTIAALLPDMKKSDIE